MPAWFQSIGQGLGRAGSEWGEAVDHNTELALSVIKNKLVLQEIQQRMREGQARTQQEQERINLEKQREQRLGAPQPWGQKIQGADGKLYQTVWNPQTGKMEVQQLPGVTEMSPEQEKIRNIEQILGPLDPIQKQAMFGVAQKETRGSPILGDDKKWYTPVYNSQQQEIRREPLGGTPLGAVPTTTSGASTYDPGTGTTSTSRTTQKGAPSPTKAPSRTASETSGTDPSWMSSPRIKSMAETWAKSGVEPSAKDKPYVEQYMAKNGLTPGSKPMGQSRSRADAAAAMVPLVKDLQSMLRDPEIRTSLGMLPGRVSEAERSLGNLSPKVQKLYGIMKSVYSLAGAMHGWRNIKVAEEFEKAYGGLHTNPDSTIAALDAMLETANAVYQAGYGKPLSSAGPGGIDAELDRMLGK